jgi:MoaA/NifB/PqqE/SkfB family radical SAM enzyme
MKTDILKEFEANLKYHFSEVLNIPLAKPHWVFISVSHKCNLNCQMCGVKKVLKEDELELSLLKQMIDEVAGWRSDSVVLLTGGEPFLRADIFEIIDYSVSRGLKTEVVSNGICIDNPEIVRRIMDSGLQNIAVSLDGVKPETHDTIRGVPGAHAKACAALIALSQEKKKRRSGPQVSAWTTIMSENLGELYDMIFWTKGLGVECLVYHPVIVTQDDMQNTVREGALWIREEQSGLLREQIDKIVAYQKKNGLVAFLHDPYLWLDYFKATLTKDQWKCNPFVFIDIGPDGSVRSCGPAFGNVKDMSLTACLETPDAEKARERMTRCPRPCLQTCWAKPEADTLTGIVCDFLAVLQGSGETRPEKKKMIEQGIALLDQCEALVLKKSAHGT